MTKQKILILGAGIAGMNIAEKISREIDADITIIEATPHAGGRCFSFRDEVSGEIIDNGQHLLSGAYTEFFDFLMRVGADNCVNGFENLTIPFFSPVHGDEYILKMPESKTGLLAAFMSQNYFSLSERLKVIKTAGKLISGLKNAEGTVADYLFREGQTECLIRAFWSPLVLAVMNTSISTAPLKLFASVMQKLFSVRSDRSNLMYPTTNFAEIFSQWEKLMKLRKVNILYSTRVKRILVNDRLAEGVELDGGDIISADLVVSALPYHALRRVLSDDVLALPGFKNLMFYRDSQILSAYFWYDKPIDVPAMFGFLNSPLQWGFNRRKLLKDKSEKKFPASFAFTVSDSENLNNLNRYEISELFSEILGDSMFEFKDLQPTHYRVIRSLKATFEAYPELENYRLEQETEIPNLYLCGDWTRTELPATIEAAALSAELAWNAMKE